MNKPNRSGTVGQLRAALEGVPDDTPLVVNAAGPDYPKEAVSKQVVTSAGFGLINWGDGYGLELDNVFALNCDFDPCGEEFRPRPVRPARQPQLAAFEPAQPETAEARSWGEIFRQNPAHPASDARLARCSTPEPEAEP